MQCGIGKAFLLLFLYLFGSVLFYVPSVLICISRLLMRILFTHIVTLQPGEFCCTWIRYENTNRY